MKTGEQQEIIGDLKFLLAQAEAGSITAVVYSVVLRDGVDEPMDWGLVGNMGPQHALALLGQNKLIDQALIDFIAGFEVNGNEN
ncbi:MAG: hypothetical protein JMN24_05135 [gamma proteobacterium endosymbiont of Lamellibrachia anaximandri]|nr:hypothetical protein [gamma proteobacterium endosymbiont of Lamellibrachia anaximandri]MBL3616222.1 hypothetical protein [gamma proteobacterium endosymbiont of Lamellibrachia anaximandri]